MRTYPWALAETVHRYREADGRWLIADSYAALYGASCGVCRRGVPMGSRGILARLVQPRGHGYACNECADWHLPGSREGSCSVCDWLKESAGPTPREAAGFA